MRNSWTRRSRNSARSSVGAAGPPRHCNPSEGRAASVNDRRVFTSTDDGLELLLALSDEEAKPDSGKVGLLSRLDVPGYRLVREVSRGGQAVVFQAVQESTGRAVAVKLLREGPLASEAERVRFDREVRI